LYNNIDKNQHDINLNADKRGSPADSEVENSNKKGKTMLDYVQRQNLEDIVSKLAAVDGISITAITRSEFIRESIASRGFKLPKNETDVMKLIHNQYEKYVRFKFSCQI
jgi:hypothetical protein